MNTICLADSRLAGLPSFLELTSKLSFNDLVQETLRQSPPDPPQLLIDYSYHSLQQQPPQLVPQYQHPDQSRLPDSASLLFSFHDSTANTLGRMELLSDAAHVRSSLAEQLAPPLPPPKPDRLSSALASQSREESAYTSLTRFFDSSPSLCATISRLHAMFGLLSSPVLQNPSGLYDSQLLYATNAQGGVCCTTSLRLKKFVNSIPPTMQRDLEASLSDISSSLAAVLFLLNSSPKPDLDSLPQAPQRKRPRSNLEPGAPRKRLPSALQLASARFRTHSVLPPCRPGEPRRRHHSDTAAIVKVCANCTTCIAPEWRRGPDGKRSLCNACGLFYKKLVNRYGERDADIIYYYRQIGDTIDRTVPGQLERNLIVEHSRQSNDQDLGALGKHHQEQS